ncbi:MAG: NUDIX domain-containing protein [Acidimicrobiales bacterium]
MRNLLYRMVQTWWRIRPPKITVGVRALVIDDEERICLVRHTYRPGWFLPGGGIKVGESLVEGMARELLEETGIQASSRPHRIQGVYSSFAEHKSDHIIVFVVTDWKGKLSHSSEIAEVRFIDPDELPEDTSPATQRRIKEYCTGAPPGHRW